MHVSLFNTPQGRPSALCFFYPLLPALFTLHAFATGVGAQANAPLAPPSLVAQARQALSADDLPGAERILRQALLKQPQSADIHFLLGYTLLYESKPAESLAEYTRGAAIHTPNVDDLLSVASDYVILNDYTDAERWLNVAVAREPRRARAWYLLGRTQYNENHALDAQRSFETCLKLEPRNIKAEYNLGLVFELLQRPDDAAAAYRSAIEWQSSSPRKDSQPYLDLGMLLRRQGKAAEALPLLLTAESQAQRNPSVYQELGLTYEALTRYDDAIREMKNALAVSPQVEALHFLLGRLYQRAGRKDEAAREFAEAARLSGTHSDAGIPNRDFPE